MDEKTVEQSMQLILYSGNGRSMVMEAMHKLFKDGDVDKARKSLQEAGRLVSP